MRNKKYILTAAEILEHVQYRQNDSSFYNETCNEELIIDDSANGTPGLRSHHEVLNKKITFTKCHFAKRISIHIDAINLNLEFHECEFSSDCNIDSFRNVFIRNCSFISKTELNVYGVGKFLFDFNNMFSSLTISGYKEDLKLSNNTTTENGFTILRISSKILKIKDCNFHNIHFDTNQVEIVSLSKCKIDTVSFEVGKFAEIYVKESEFKALTFNETLKDISLEISNSSVISFLAVNGNSISNLNITGCEFDKLQFEGSTYASQYYKVQGAYCENLDFRNFICQAKVSFVDVTVGKGGKISFISSDLEDLQFIKCEFSNAILYFENSRISKIFTAVTDFPSRIETNKELHKWAQAQLAFGQLANSYKDQGDTVRYLDYQARELYAHMKKLKYKDDRAGYINLWANYISNDFGRNWIRCLLITVVFAILAFYFLVNSSKQYSIGYGWNFDPQLIKAFFHFFNPIRDTDTEKIFEFDGKSLLKLSVASYVIDLISHIVLAFLFYQTIQAFRRYGRSG